MKARFLLIIAVILCTGASVGAASDSRASHSADVRDARAVLERNLRAFKSHDVAAYLLDFLHSTSFVSFGPGGTIEGFDAFAASARSERMPDQVEVRNLRFESVEPGVVVATYDYRVRFGAEEISGMSERVMVKRSDGWKIAAATSVDVPRTSGGTAIVRSPSELTSADPTVQP